MTRNSNDDDIANRIIDKHLANNQVLHRLALVDASAAARLHLYREFLADACTALRLGGIPYDETARLLDLIAGHAISRERPFDTAMIAASIAMAPREQS